MSSIPELMQQGMEHHMHGRLAEAEAMYRQVLAIEPLHPFALHHLGAIAHQCGKNVAALELVDTAISNGSFVADFHNTRGAICIVLGRYEQAAESARKALELRPGYAEAHHTLGSALVGLGKPDDAAGQFREAIRLKPDFPLAVFHLGEVLVRQNQVDEAISAFRGVLELQPEFADGHAGLGFALGKKGDLLGATAALERAAALRPRFPQAHFYLGMALEQQGKMEQAVTAYRRAVDLKSGYGDAMFNLGVALEATRQRDEAVAVLEELIRLEPDRIGAHVNLGVTLGRRGEYQRAYEQFQWVLERDPAVAAAHGNLGLALMKLGRLPEAIAACRAALEREPEDPETHGMFAEILLLHGDYEEGWREYEWRWKCARFRGRKANFCQAPWTGFDIAGRTILLHHEQGRGDAIQFARFVPQVAGLGAKVVLMCVPDLAPLLCSVRGVQRLVTQGQPLPDFDVQATLLSLPRALGTTLANIPADVPYLQIEPRLLELWSDRMRPYQDKCKVGLVWAGSPEHVEDELRSCQLSDFASLAQVPGVVFFSLQKGANAHEAARPPPGMTVVNLTGGLSDFAHTGALIAQLDLVICVDTAVAHLAGALGKPVWNVLQYAPDWRWMLNRADTPWYPTMRLFRQHAARDWSGVFGEVGQELGKFVADRIRA